jgi:hypothetical protein
MLALKTPEAAEKLLARLGVHKIDYSLIGSKGVRYRKTDIEEALAAIEVDPTPPAKKKRPAKPRPGFFDLSIKEQMALLTADTLAQ